MTRPPVESERGDRFRRVLLGAITALVVARPLVAGEDPGRLRSPESISGIWINMFWIAAALLGALWLARSRRPLRLGGWVPASLHVVTIVVLVTTLAVSCYRHPGVLMTWEWVTVGLAFLLVRAVASDADPSCDSGGGLPAAGKASQGSLAVYGIYQTIGNRTGLPIPELGFEKYSVAASEADFLGATPGPTDAAGLVCRGTFQHPDTLIAVLLLTLPALGVFALSGRDLRHQIGKVVLLIPIAAIVLSGVDFVSGGEVMRLIPGVDTAWRMFTERPLLGVGPGNFDRHAPRLQPPELPAILPDGGNVYLDLLATGGLLLFVAVVAAFVLVLVHGRRHVTEDPPEPADDRSDAEGPRWEFYLGGVAGLLIGLILRLADHPAAAPAQSILQVGVGAIIRAIVWFLAFALFESTAWRSALRRRAIVIGIAAVVVFGLVSPAPLRPAVLQPLVVLAAVAMTTRPIELTSAPSRLRWLPVAALFVVAFVYFSLVSQPIYFSASSVTDARRAARLYPERFARADAASVPVFQAAETIKLTDYLSRSILLPLGEARRADPYDIGPVLELAMWYALLWKLDPEQPQDDSLDATGVAAERDPYGTAALTVELQLHLTYALVTKKNLRASRRTNPADVRNLEERRLAHLREAELLIGRIVERNPALEARLRYRLAQTLLALPDALRNDEGREVAKRVWDLEQNARGPRWQLTREQRHVVRRWLKMPLESGERMWLSLPIDPSLRGAGWAPGPLTVR